ncbi:MAG: hypothetical protein HKN47_07210 [Pirellulaceae bacterium]|nr:hypothetical protein [Pirellulaceae bacterium]
MRLSQRGARFHLTLLAATLTGFVAHATIAVAETPDTKSTPQTARPTTADLDYFSIDVGPMVKEFNKSHIVSDPPILRGSFHQMKTDPRVVVPTGVEAYLLEPDDRNNQYDGYRIIGRKPVGTAAQGQFFLLRRHPDQPRESVLAKFDFNVGKRPTGNAHERDFYQAKGEHFQRLWSSEYAGAAMFRHLAMESMNEIGKQAKPVGPNWPLRRNQGTDATISMMAGGRAISENLQLDNQLDDPKNYLGELKNLSEVRGITVNEIDWTRRLSKKPTPLDPLAKLVPHNQYAVFVPSFEMLATIVDRGNELARPLVHWFEPQSRVTNVLGLYQTQLGLPLNALTRQVGDVMIGEVAVTGSDPYFRTGTDIAVLMRTEQPALLYQAITAQVAAQAVHHQNVSHVDHKVDGHVFTQWSNPTRHLSSFVAVEGNAVIVSNSLHQMMQVLKCADEEVKTMHELDEYKFFRQRYPRGSENAAALVVVTDAAIRRWCGPQWRISASRRTRARATIAEATMQHADELLEKTIQSDTVFHSDSQMPNAGTLTLTPSGVYSPQYGTLDFQTPIAEMKLWKATTQEVALYTTWRNRYERRWRRVFDPIAVEIKLQDNQLAADLTVIPLVVQSEYQRYMQIVGQARLKPTAGDHHSESLASIDIALDTNAPMFAMARMFLQSQNNGLNLDPLAWIDGSASFYFDHDEQWLQRLENRDPWDFDFEELVVDIPVGFHIPSKDSLRLTAFMVGVRSLLNQFAPNTIEWGSGTYKEFDYITAVPRQPRQRDGQPREMKAYYITLPDGLTLSGNQRVIERAIDRYLARQERGVDQADAPIEDDGVDIQPNQPEATTPDPSDKLAPQLAVKMTGRGVLAMTKTNYQSGLRRAHRIAWSNLPILNYFRNRYPERDPFEVYESLFGQKLIEPSGGQYKWDDRLGTYVSTNHGYHLEPKAGPALAPGFDANDVIATTLSFQDGGLRATLNVTDVPEAD